MYVDVCVGHSTSRRLIWIGHNSEIWRLARKSSNHQFNKTNDFLLIAQFCSYKIVWCIVIFSSTTAKKSFWIFYQFYTGIPYVIYSSVLFLANVHQNSVFRTYTKLKTYATYVIQMSNIFQACSHCYCSNILRNGIIQCAQATACFQNFLDEFFQFVIYK